MSETLPRILKLRDLILLVVGMVIGSGIFIVPAAVLRQTGGEIGPALLVWLIAGGLSLLGALTYGELGARDPGSGGLYVYIRDAFGRFPAFLYGWTLFFVIGSGTIATLAVASTGYLAELLPIGSLAARAIAVAMIAVLAALNVRGTHQSVSVQDWTTVAKAGAIVVLSVLLLSLGDGLGGGEVRVWPERVTPSLLSGIGLAMIGTLWAYEGWQYVTFAAGETLDPQRTFPRGLVAGTVALIAIYLLANLAYLAALGPEQAAASNRVAAAAVGAILGPGAAKLIAAVIVLSMFSAANGMMLTAPRAFFSMARDRIFFARLADVHPRFGTPAVAILATSAWAMVLAMTGTFEQLLTYVVFTGWIFYGLGAMSVFAYRRRRPDEPRPFEVPGYPWTPLLFVVSAAAIVANTLFTQPTEAFLGLGIVALGTPAYFVWRARARAAVPAADASAAASRQTV